MSKVIGQLVYNLTINGKTYSNISESQLTTNAFTVISPGGTPLTKLGIQAPVGTIVNINNQDIVIGRTEVYEILPGVEVTSLYFPKDKNTNLYNILVDYIY